MIVVNEVLKSDRETLSTSSDGVDFIITLCINPDGNLSS